MALKLPMTYESTRGGDVDLQYCDIVLKGLAQDGGLFMPRVYPQVTRTDLEDWRHLSYAELAFEILRLFATDIDEAILKAMVSGVYREEVYNNGRRGEDFSKITPVRSIDKGAVRILELSNGPTLAFKDMAMQYLGALFEYVLAQKGCELNILGATSGDTGSAAEYAMRGRKGVRVFMLSPEGRMSDFQRAQMYSLTDPNVFNIAVKGTFDDAQDIVKACSRDAAFKTTYSIGTVNSINWARVSAQVVYYFKGWLEVTETPGEVIDVTVPSGNFGNILAGWIAKQMGLPIGQLVVATNENDVLDEFFRTGVYRVRDADHTFVTSSPSMDISKASNFERYVYDIVGRNGGRIKELWTELALKGGFALSEGEMMRVRESGFVSSRSTHAERLSTIRQVFETEGFLIDPHTADGVNAARRHLRRGVKMLALETALPAKFADTIRQSVGADPEVPPAYKGIEDRPQYVTVLPADEAAVKAFIADTLKGQK